MEGVENLVETKNVRLSILEDSLYFSLRSVLYSSSFVQFLTTLQTLDLTFSEYRVLSVISRRRSPHLKIVADGVALSNANASVIVKRMVTKSYVMSRPSRWDRRVRHLDLTPLGKKTLESAVLARLRLQRELELKLGGYENLSVLADQLALLLDGNATIPNSAE